MKLNLISSRLTQPKMHSEIVSITPDMAKDLITKNAKYNRKLTKTSVEKYARAMVKGDWALTPQGIIVETSTDEVIDGQHRLHAIAQTGVTVDMYVTYVTGENTYKFLDQGRKRDFADLSGLPKSVTVVVHQTLRLADTQLKGITYAEAEPYLFGRLGREAQEFYDNVNPTGYMWNNAVFKSMAICSIIAGKMPKQEVYDLYNNFLNLNTEGMSPCRRNFLRQVMHRDVVGMQTIDRAVVSKAYHLFSRNGDKMQICRYSEVAYDRGLDVIQRAVALGK